jgi:arylsulfatase A-like enzyme
MKPNRLVAAAAAMLSAFSVNAQPESTLSIITNADIRVIPARRTSIIYIQCDGLGTGDLSCYGQKNFQTPNLDKMAAEGVRFTDFRPDGTNFASALAALLSGKKSGENGDTVAARLRDVGYHTCIVGEWGFGEKPGSLGFEEFAGFLNDNDSRDYYAAHLRRFAPHAWLTESNTFTDYDGVDTIYDNLEGKKGKYMPEFFLSTVVCDNYVRIHKPDAANKYQPYFLLVNLPAPRSATAGRDDFPVPSDAPYSDEPWPQAAKDRAALITRIDGSIGRLFEKFKEYGISNDVAVVFSSSAAPEKFADSKLNSIFGVNTNGNLPLIVWWPQGTGAKHVSDFKITSADFAPTALDIGYAKPVKNLDGISILPVLEGKEGQQIDSPTISPDGVPQLIKPRP